MNKSIKNQKIQHGLYKNLPTGTVYNSQAGTIIFALGMAFKVSVLPGIISENYGSSTLWAYLVLMAAELMITALVFAFVKMRGDGFLRATSSRAYKIICLILSLWLTAKGTFFFCYSASYLTSELFGGISPSLVYFLLISPVVYLGIKGARSIARTSEIFVPVFAALILFNFIFLQTDMDIGRNLPVFAIEPKEFFLNIPRFSLWLGDALPFAFLRIKNKKLPYLGVSIGATTALILTTVFLGVAMYGDSLKTVSDLLIRIAGFNQLSQEIGRMEWTNLFSVVALSMLSLGFIYFGCIASANRAGLNLPAKILHPTAVLAVAIFARSTQAATQFALDKLGYILGATALLIPISMLLVFCHSRSKLKGIYACLDSEYTPYPPPSPALPNSLADNVLDGFKEQATRTQTVLANGSLEPPQKEE